MEKRKGYSRYNETLYPGGIEYLDTFKTKEIEVMMVCTPTKLYADGLEICTVNKTIVGLTYLNNYYFVDGENIRVFGKMPQTPSSHIVLIGTPINEYKVFTIVNPPTGFTPLAKPAIFGKWNYDYDYSNIWYEPCQNELEDTYKGANLLPTSPTIIAMHGDRLYMNGDAVNPGNVFITDVQNAFYMPVGLPIQMPPNGQEINSMSVYMDSLVVGRKTDVNIIYGNTNRTTLDSGIFTRKSMNVHCGMANHNATSLAHDMLFYLGDDGIVYRMITPQSDIKTLSTRVISSSLDLKTYPINLTQDKFREMTSLFHDELYYLFHKDVTLVYSYKYQAWTIYKGLSITCATVKDDVIYFGGSDGYVYIQNNDYNDNDMPYPAYWGGKRLDFGTSSNYKQFKDIYVVAHVFDNYKSDIRIRYEIDYVDVQQIAEIKNQISKWGNTLWGDRFITRNISPSLPINIGRRGRKLRINIMNGYIVDNVFTTYENMINQIYPVTGQLYKALDVNKFYFYNIGVYTEIDRSELFQPMKVYEINGEYQIKEKR
jgi:hypothetical protein